MRLNDVDLARGVRIGVPEVVLAVGKSDAALVEAVDALLAAHPVLVTRCSAAQSSLLAKEFGTKIVETGRLSGTLAIGSRGGSRAAPTIGKVAVVSAGASDLAVAEEACVSARYFGMAVHEIRDCGIAGLHRTTRAADALREQQTGVAIVVAGMEGALPSVLASLVPQPVVAVPTSVGYGTGAGGLAALMTMLNSCVPGVVVVNIDNGFGAAAAAWRILGTSRSRPGAK